MNKTKTNYKEEKFLLGLIHISSESKNAKTTEI